MAIAGMVCLYTLGWQGSSGSCSIIISFLLPTVALPCKCLGYDTGSKEGRGVSSGPVFIQWMLGQKEMYQGCISVD